MKNIAQKLVEVERQMAKEKGSFFLFALFLREDAPDLWDLLVSAAWIDADKGKALRYIASKLSGAIKPKERAMLSRIAIVEQTNPALAAIQSAFHVEHGLIDVENSNFFGLQIKHAYIVTSRKDGK